MNMNDNDGRKARDTSWGGVADWYHGVVEGDGSYQKEVIMPNLIRLVGPYSGQRILDLACGQGFFSRAFRDGGAQVVGVDAGAELIGLAKKDGRGIEYHVSSADSMPFLESGHFDVVTIVLAIQNIEPMNAVFSECSRLLKNATKGSPFGGKLFLVLNHPAFRIPSGSRWGFDDEANVQYRRVDRYLSQSVVDIDMEPSKSAVDIEISDKIRPSKNTVSFHRPLQAYFKALEKNGFTVTRLEEWTSHKKSQKGPRQVAEDRARKEIPLFMMIEAAKFQ